MKYIPILLLGIFLLVSCNQKKNASQDEVVEQAVEAIELNPLVGTKWRFENHQMYSEYEFISNDSMLLVGKWHNSSNVVRKKMRYEYNHPNIIFYKYGRSGNQFLDAPAHIEGNAIKMQGMSDHIKVE